MVGLITRKSQIVSVRVGVRIRLSIITYYFNFTFLKVWKGNVADSNYKTEVFSPFVVAQYIRLHPTHCSNQCAFRLEFYGCNVTAGKRVCVCVHVQT